MSHTSGASSSPALIRCEPSGVNATPSSRPSCFASTPSPGSSEIRLSSRAGYPAHGPISAVAAAPDGDRFATAGDQGVWLWSVATQRAQLAAPAPASVVAYAPQGDLLVSGGADQQLRAWSSGKLVVRKLRHAITALAFSEDGRRLAIGGPSSIELRSATGGIADRATTTFDGAAGQVQALVFACGGSCVVSGNKAGIAEVWDTATGKLLATRA